MGAKPNRARIRQRAFCSVAMISSTEATENSGRTSWHDPLCKEQCSGSGSTGAGGLGLNRSCSDTRLSPPTGADTTEAPAGVRRHGEGQPSAPSNARNQVTASASPMRSRHSDQRQDRTPSPGWIALRDDRPYISCVSVAMRRQYSIGSTPGLDIYCAPAPAASIRRWFVSYATLLWDLLRGWPLRHRTHLPRAAAWYTSGTYLSHPPSSP
jgi:hypothetical protein